MIYIFARVGAVLQMNLGDYFTQREPLFRTTGRSTGYRAALCKRTPTR